MNEIILVGNPNVGKTTLLNTLTGSNERVGNWHGVTVEEKTKLYKHNNQEIKITDLPGIYSIKGFSNEEKLSRDYILKNQDKIFINICDENKFLRCLKLTVELINLGLKIILVVNTFNKKSLTNYSKFEEELGVKIIVVDAKNKKGILPLKQFLHNVICEEKTQKIFKTNKKRIIYSDLINKFAKNDKISPNNKDEIIDKFILNKVVFIIGFLFVIFLVFYFTFGSVGLFLTDVFKLFLNKIAVKMRLIINCTNISLIVKNVIFDVVIDGLVSVLSFLPQIIILTFCFGVIEECGLMSRVSFMLDGILKKVGLTGKSIFSLSMGFGCTTPAVMTTRNLENFSLRKRTILMLPFVPCSAKLPIILTLISLFFNNHKYLFIFIAFLIYFLFCFGVAFFNKKVAGEVNDFLIFEMPRYKIPSIKKLLNDIYKTAKDFLLKVATVILFFNFFVWLLQNFSFDFQFLNGAQFERSMLYKIASIFVPVFNVVGLGKVEIVVALFLGLVAKELVLSSLVLMGVGFEIFSPISAIVFLVFVMIYSPCVSSLAMIKNEIGFKFSAYVFVFQFALAFLVSFLVYQILTRPYFLIWTGVFIVLDIFILVVLKLKKKKTCRGNCCACRKI